MALLRPARSVLPRSHPLTAGDSGRVHHRGGVLQLKGKDDRVLAVLDAGARRRFPLHNELILLAPSIEDGPRASAREMVQYARDHPGWTGVYVGGLVAGWAARWGVEFRCPPGRSSVASTRSAAAWAWRRCWPTSGTPASSLRSCRRCPGRPSWTTSTAPSPNPGCAASPPSTAAATTSSPCRRPAAGSRCSRSGCGPRSRGCRRSASTRWATTWPACAWRWSCATGPRPRPRALVRELRDAGAVPPPIEVTPVPEIERDPGHGAKLELVRSVVPRG